MNLKKANKTVISALFTAIICLATYLIHFQISFGYFNLGDCFVLLAGWILGPVYGFIAAGTGAALADVISGYAIYAPATFIIKGIMAVTACAVSNPFKKSAFTGKIISGAVAEAEMILGYFLFESVFLGLGMGAVSAVPLNIIQGIIGAITAPIVFRALNKTKTLKSIKRG